MAGPDMGGEVVAVLSRRLGPGYRVESDGGRRVTVRKNALMYADISINDQPGASVFGVHGGGFIYLRLVTTFGTARRVPDALRRSPEFPQPVILPRYQRPGCLLCEGE